MSVLDADQELLLRLRDNKETGCCIYIYGEYVDAQSRLVEV